MPIISFGDNVRVRSEPEMVKLGLAGLRGSVYGMTTPSKTGIEVIGSPQADYAVNVHLDDLGKTFWMAPELLEFIDHAPSLEVTIAGKKMVRAANGEWREQSLTAPWWKFWKN